MSVKDIKLNVAGFIPDSIVDGPGVRGTLFLQGCPHHCKGCHNPETWDPNVDHWKTVEEVANMIVQVKGLRRLTFSGGDPIGQAYGLNALLTYLKTEYNKDYDLIIYTGYTFEELISMDDKNVNILLHHARLLIDGRYVEAEKSMECRFRGSKNQRIIDLPNSLMLQKLVLSGLN